MANLYEINKEILECIDLETGEIIDFEKLNQLKLERNQKIESIALWIKNLVVEEEAIKKEIETLAERKKSKAKKIEQLKEYLGNALEYKKFETPKVAISYRKSDSLNVIDENQINEKFIKITETRSIDKTAIKTAIKNGEVIEGVELIEKQNIQIK